MQRRTRLPLAAACLVAGACNDQVTSPAPAVSTPVPGPSAVVLDSGYIVRDGVPIRVRYEVRNGRGIFEGDIDLGPVANIARTKEDVPRSTPSGASPNVVTTNLGLRWPGGIIPYTIESDVANPSRATDAFASIESAVHGVDFVPRTTQTDYIIVRRTTDPAICGQSSLGRQGGAQILLVKDSCSSGVIIHEAAHALGIWHEQSRCDRDNFVLILYQNIVAGFANQFDKVCTGAADVFAYDEGSILHYPPTAFSANGLPTIQSKRGLDGLMGQRLALSGEDAKSIDWMYHPFAPPGMAVTYPGNRATISWNAARDATGYVVTLVVRVYINDYEHGSSEQDYRHYVGSTTALSIQDFATGYGTYTGTDSCHYDTMYTSETDTYWYEVIATYPGAPSQPATFSAAVASC